MSTNNTKYFKITHYRVDANGKLAKVVFRDDNNQAYRRLPNIFELNQRSQTRPVIITRREISKAEYNSLANGKS